jgi:protein TonB
MTLIYKKRVELIPVEALANYRDLKPIDMNHFTKKNKALEKLRGIYFQIGLIIAGGLTLVAFEWTTPISNTTLGGVLIDEIEEDYVFNENFVIIEKLKEVIKIEKPKVDLSKIKIVPDNTEEIKEEPKEFVEEEKATEFKEGEWERVEEVLEVDPIPFAQNMPHYLDCAAMNEEERKVCTRNQMFKHFGKKMSIPTRIKMKGAATYIAYVYFEVNRKGKISNVKILNDENHKIPRELEREAYEAVSTLPDLVPGKNHGKKVKVLYKIPINFTVKG